MFRDNNDPHAIDLPLAARGDWVQVRLPYLYLNRARAFAAKRNLVSVTAGRKDNHGLVPDGRSLEGQQFHERSAVSCESMAFSTGGGMNPSSPIDSFAVRGNVGNSKETPLRVVTRSEVGKPDLRVRPGESWRNIYILADYDGGNTVTLKGWLLAFEAVLLGGVFDRDRNGRPNCWYVSPSQLYCMSELFTILRELGPNNEGWLIPPDVYPSVLFEPQGWAGVEWEIRLLEAWQKRK